MTSVPQPPHDPTMDRRLSLLGFAVMFLVGTDTFIVAPLIPTLASTYGVTVGRAGWLVSSYAFGYALTALVAGPVSDRRDRRGVLALGIAVFAVSTLLCATAASFWVMVAYRFVAGAAAAIASPQVWASIPALVPPGRVLHVLGYATAGLSIAQVVGVPVGSWLAVLDWRAPFVVVGAASVLLAGALIAFFPRVPPPSQRAPRVTYAALFRRPEAWRRFGSYFAYMLAFFTVFTYAPAWLAAMHHLSLSAIGVVILVAGVGNMLGSLFGSRVTSRTTLPRSMRVGAVVMGVAYASLCVAPTAAVIAAALFVVFVCGGALLSVRMLHLQQLRPDARGTISSLTSAVMYLATTVAGMVGGPLLRVSPDFVAVSLLAGALALLSGAVVERRNLNPR